MSGVPRKKEFCCLSEDDVERTAVAPAKEEPCCDPPPLVGEADGLEEGTFVGSEVGEADGLEEGTLVGSEVGSNVGLFEGEAEGACVGNDVGEIVENSVGA